MPSAGPSGIPRPTTSSRSPRRSPARTCVRWARRSSEEPPGWMTPSPTFAAPRLVRPRDSSTRMVALPCWELRARPDPETTFAARCSWSGGGSSPPLPPARPPLGAQLTVAGDPQPQRDVAPGELWTRILTERPSPGGRVIRAEVHPGRRPALDTSPGNDVRSLDATPGPALTVGGWFLYAAELVVAAVGSLL